MAPPPVPLLHTAVSRPQDNTANTALRLLCLLQGSELPCVHGNFDVSIILLTLGRVIDEKRRGDRSQSKNKVLDNAAPTSNLFGSCSLVTPEENAALP